MDYYSAIKVTIMKLKFNLENIHDYNSRFRQKAWYRTGKNIISVTISTLSEEKRD